LSGDNVQNGSFCYQIDDTQRRYKMTSIIINNFYRALLKIEEEEGFSKYNAKTLAVRLVDDLYPEDGYIALEDDPRGSLRVHLDERFLARIRGEIAKGLDLKEATEAVGFKQEAEVPVAPPPPEVKEVKVKVVKPKLTKEQKEAEKAAKEAEKAAKAAKEAEKAAKATKEAEKANAMVEEVTDKMATMSVNPPPKKKAPKPKFVGNLEKMNATHEKLWKKVAAEKKVELNDDLKKQFLAQMNALDNTVYNAKKLEAHMTEFFTTKEPAVRTEPLEMTETEFKGKTYYVTDDGDVYDPITQEDGSVVDKRVGKVGQLYFSEMEMPA